MGPACVLLAFVAALLPVAGDAARDGGATPVEWVGSCIPPESLPVWRWAFLGRGPGWGAYFDTQNIAYVDGSVDVWLIVSGPYRRLPDDDPAPYAPVQRIRIDCGASSFAVEQEHYFSLPRGRGCYLGGTGSLRGGLAMRRRHPLGWKEDIVAGTPVALAALAVCPPGSLR